MSAALAPFGVASAALALLTIVPSSASAHGRPPSLQALVFDAEDPQRIAAQATWGMAFSEDGGESWSWSCSAAYGVDARMEDPSLARASDGSLVTGTFGGVLESRLGRGCSWEPAEPSVSERFGIDLQNDGRGGLLMVATDGATADRLWRRADGVWSEHSEPIERVLIDRVRVAPSNPDVVYLTGSLPRRADQERALFAFRSGDGGRSFGEPTEVVIRGQEYGFQAAAVAPNNADVLWAVVLHFDGATVAERLMRSTDGARSFETRLTIPQVGGVVILGDGDTVLAGSKLGGLWRSENAGDTWRKLHDVAVRCLVQHGDELWICTDQGRDGLALAVSRDRGETMESVLELPELLPMRACPACSEVGIVCPAWTPDVAFDLNLDFDALGIETPELNPDGGVGLPREILVPEACGGPPIMEKPGGCGCSTPGSSNTSWLWLAFWVLQRRRRKAKANSPKSAGTPPAAEPAAT